jgi:hypothetical protein
VLRRLLVASALLLGTVATLPATAAVPATFTGRAGTYAEVRLTRPATFDFSGSDIGLAKADRGNLVGVALVSPAADHWVVYTRGQVAGTACAFGSPCDRYDFPSLDGSSRYDGDGRLTLPAGVYRVALLGRPGANVQVSVVLPGVSGVVRTTRTAHLRVDDLASLYPSTPDEQPQASTEITYANTGPAVTGVTMRLDTDNATSAWVDYCLADGDGINLPAGTICSGSSESGSIGVYYLNCPSSPLHPYVCVPTGSQRDALSLSMGAVLGAKAHMSFNSDVRALKSRVAMTAFSLTF